MSEPLRDRLRRLLREAPAPVAAQAKTLASVAARGGESLANGDASPAPGGVSPALERAPLAHDAVSHPFGVVLPSLGTDELHRRLARRGVLLDAHRNAGASAADEPARMLALGPPERLDPSCGGAIARTSSFAREHQHGACSLAAGLAFDRAQLAVSARDERFAEIDLARAVFLDTETSGLAGGTGTYVFLVGLGTFQGGRFDVWQGFLSDPRDERALLLETAERIAAAPAIVSFFGKSFDRHRLEDKMRVHGLVPPFAHVPHLDLYWPLRRAHQGRFENCRLKTLERELAGVVRADDLPGSFAPAAWFDFLAGRPHRLEGVFRHNLEDVLSLVALLPHAAVVPVPRA